MFLYSIRGCLIIAQKANISFNPERGFSVDRNWNVGDYLPFGFFILLQKPVLLEVDVDRALEDLCLSFLHIY